MTWRELIAREMTQHGESFQDVVDLTLNRDELDEQFDCMSAAPEGTPFTLWTDRRVYFPTVYDGNEDVGSVPRNPNQERTDHV